MSEIENEDIFTPHSEKQDKAIFSDSKITLCCTGVQFGKTTIGARWLQRLTMLYTDPQDNFIVTAPTYKILNQSTLPELLRTFGPFGEFRKGDMEFRIHGGGIIYIRTETEPDSIVGIRRVRAVWGDEAGKYRLYFWQNMLGRAAPLNAPIILTTTPYSLNWIYKEIIKPFRLGKLDDVTLIEAKSKENPYFSTEEYERQKRVMDPRKFKALFDGQFEKMQGLVYDCVDDDIEINDFHPPTDTVYYGGIDWGYNDPFVLVIRAVTKEGFHCQVSEFFKTGLIPSEVLQVLKDKMGIFPMKRIFCDPSQPGMIEMLQRASIPATKANNDITVGIGDHYELIKSGRFKILKGTSPHSLDEYEQYHYPEPADLSPDQDQKKDKPVDQHNHCMDAVRYCSIHTKNIHKRKAPNVPEPSQKRDHEMPHEYVKRIRRFKPKTFESWS